VRIRVWFALVMAAAALTPTVITGGLLIQTANEAASVRPEESLAREATTLATAVATWLDAQSAALTGWRRVWKVESQSEELRTGLLRAVYKAVDPVVTVALIDGDRQPAVAPVWLPIETVDPGRTPGSREREAAFLERAPVQLPASGTALSDPYLPPGSNTPVVPISVAPPGSELLLAAELDLGALARLFGGRDDHAAVLLDGARRPLLGGDHRFVTDQQVRAVTEPGMDLSFATEGADGQLRGAVSAVPGTDWVVVSVEPAALAAEATDEMRNQTLLVGLLVLLVGAAVGYGLERTISQPIARLRSGAAAVAAGRFDERISLSGPSEVEDLADAFNDMTAKLQANREELAVRQQRIEAFNEELQERVAERTSELRDTQAQLVQAGQIAAVAEVGAGLAHELNNPMTAILGTVQVMMARSEGDPVQLERLEAQVLRCREVVSTMVRFASGEVDPRLAPMVDLGVVARSTLDELRGTYLGRGLDLEFHPPSVAAMTGMDPAFANQMIARIIEAVSIGLPETGVVRLDVAVTERGIELAVDASPRPVAADDQRASGMRSWVTRRMVDLAGGLVETAADGGAPWRVVLPEAEA
jgi:signal transduction histidine kinase